MHVVSGIASMERPAAATFGMAESGPAALSDAKGLMARVKRTRDREAFTALFLLFAPRVKTYLVRQGASPLQAEELAQEALLILWREADRFDADRASVAGWIFTIARNLRIDALRRERSATAYALHLPEPDAPPSPEADAAAADRQSRLQDAVRGLPADQLDLIRRSYFQDMTHVEIAEALELPLGTVKSRLRLALQKLRRTMGELS